MDILECLIEKLCLENRFTIYHALGQGMRTPKGSLGPKCLEN